MKEKVIDIKPPKAECDREKNATRQNNNNDCPRKKGWIIPLFLVLIALAGYFYYVSYRTEITIYPVVEEFEEEMEVLVRASGALGENEIRGVVLSERVSDRKEFPIEGRRLIEEKAEGEIEVCQDYSSSGVNFVEGTRFVSNEGKFFFAKDGFSLPPRESNNGCAQIEVVAAESGEEYNASSDSKFVLPGLEGSAIYSKVEGLSFNLTKEGVSEEVPYLDDETMDRAQAEMEEDLFQKGKEILTEKYAEEYLLTTDSQYTVEIVERSFDEDSEQDDKFYFTLDVNVKAIAKSKEALDDFVKNLLEEGRTWKKETEDIEISFLRINFSEQEASVLLDIAIETYQDFNKEEWRRNLAGIDFGEAKKKLKEGIEVDEVEIKTWPFGLGRVVNDSDRVKINIEFDKN